MDKTTVYLVILGVGAAISTANFVLKLHETVKNRHVTLITNVK